MSHPLAVWQPTVGQPVHPMITIQHHDHHHISIIINPLILTPLPLLALPPKMRNVISGMLWAKMAMMVVVVGGGAANFDDYNNAAAAADYDDDDDDDVHEDEADDDTRK